MNILETKFQYYPARVNTRKYIGWVNLKYFINAQKYPKPEVLKIFDEIKKAESDNDMELKAKLKQENLFYFTPCVNILNYRRYTDITSFTGIMVLDFDHIDNAGEFRDYIFNEYNFIISAYLSPSARGVKFLVHIPICKDVIEFKERYYAISKIFDIYDGWDSSNKNSVLPLFQSFDSELLFREYPNIFTGREPDLKSLPSDSVKITIPHNVSNKERLIYKIAETGISKISAPGHPQLRSICIALGGYVATGYISKIMLINYVDSLIESNSYLRKGISGYKKTARWAINEGLKIPIII